MIRQYLSEFTIWIDFGQPYFYFETFSNFLGSKETLWLWYSFTNKPLHINIAQYTYFEIYFGFGQENLP